MLLIIVFIMIMAFSYYEHSNSLFLDMAEPALDEETVGAMSHSIGEEGDDLLTGETNSIEDVHYLELETKEITPLRQTPIQRLGGAEASIDYPGIKQHPQKNGIVFEPSLLLKQDVDILPDTLGTAGGKEDYFRDGILHVGNLDADFIIPEGYYVYRIQGEYLDVMNDQNVTLSFVDEYVFTVRDVEEEVLIEDIRSYLKKTHNSNDASYRGPGYVVWDFRVFHKKYLPVENLFVSALADTGEYFEKGDYYISIGRRLWWGPSKDKRDPDGGSYVHVFYDTGVICDYTKLPGFPGSVSLQAEIDAGLLIQAENWPVEDWIGGMIDATGNHGLITESHDAMPIATGGSSDLCPLLYNAKSMYKCGISACLINDTLIDGRDYLWIVSNLDASPISSKWQENYQYALEELENHPEEYTYPEVRFSFQEEYFTVRYTRWWMPYDQNQLRKGWTIDQEQDRELRAAVFADMKGWYSDVDLSRIMILLKDTGEGQLFGAYLLDEEEPYTMSVIMLSWDAIPEMDLEFLREYGEKYIFLQ